MIVVGHRGGRGEAPENTLTGFQQALDAGIRHFELDIQLSFDNQIMVFHDTGLLRTTGVSGKLSQWSAAALTGLKASRPWVHPWEQVEIPTLSEVLALLSPGCEWVQLEIKQDSLIRMDRLCRELDFLLTAHQFRDQAILTSFNTWVLKQARRILPDVRRGYVTDRVFDNPVYTARELGASFVIPHYKKADETLVKSAHQHGLHVSTWTVNDEDQARRLGALGVDSVITDYPRRFSQNLLRKDGSFH